MEISALWYAFITSLLIWGLQSLWQRCVWVHAWIRALVVRLHSALLEDQQSRLNPSTGVVVEGSVFAETLCDNVLRLVRINDRKLGETLVQQLRQREDLESLVRGFGQEFRDIVHDWDTAMKSWKHPWTTWWNNWRVTLAALSEFVVHAKTKPCMLKVW